MYIYKQHHYYVYIVTNPQRTVLYTGVTNNLEQRLIEHWLARGHDKTFAGRYYCYNLVYFEYYTYILNAIAREKEIKGWNRRKKIELIENVNPKWVFMNEELLKKWPPDGPFKSRG